MGKSKPITYDSTKFVQVSHGFLMTPRPARWPPELWTVTESLESAIHMASQIDLIDNVLSSSRPNRVRAAYFRASLTELCRVEDVTKSRDRKFSFHKSDDPSLHIVKLLRNYQVHISATQLSAGSTKVICAGEIMEHYSYIAENVTASQLRMLERSDGYSDEQLAELVMLFEQQQRRFGVVQLLYFLAKRVEEYAMGSLVPHKAKLRKEVCRPT